jgi:hypothetical protein
MEEEIKDVCKKHRREYEMYCKTCTPRLPLCPGCACDHYIEKHGMQVCFIEEDVKKGLEKLDKGLVELGQKKDIITKYTKDAEKITKEKNNVKKKMDEMIRRGKDFYETQAKVAIEKHEKIIKCYEAIMKATNDCEHRIKVSMDSPMRMKDLANKLTKEKKYISAMSKVEGAIISETVFDYSKILAQMSHYETLIKEYNSFLTDIDTGVFDIPTGKKLKADKEALDVEHANLKSKSFMLAYLFRGPRETKEES